MRRRTWLRLGAVATTASLAGCLDRFGGDDEVTDERSEEYDPPANAAVAVSNTNGPVTVEAGDGDELVLDVVERTTLDREALAAVTVDVRTDGDRVLVETTADSERARGRVTVDLTLTVPSAVWVEEVTTANGPVELSGTTGDTVVRTANGGIEVEAVDGYVTLETSNGSVEARDVAGIDGATTANGSVDLDVRALRRDAAVRTSNGSVDLALAADLSAVVTARTSNGAVDVEGVRFEEESGSRTELSGRLGEGEHALSVETTNGRIDLRALEG
ncbi:DUF4097 family beta strand repeat-containing protein [Halomarina ordinaria]|uniref:DUF4097 family beta strand repeat-containing protein n=1 Tax=Halomarina ordinaria TaxID=3033939 RepID=A0ABD5UFC0_9EURY|nr:DUF4097 family beta strand repeat-containing protein [Halomarina sp. PSRA2]